MGHDRYRWRGYWVGIAVDAASRDYSVLLLEQSDFGKGTSSRSTKLVHGGVRYLKQGNVSLVREALEERAILSAQRAACSPRFVVHYSLPKLVASLFLWYRTQTV